MDRYQLIVRHETIDGDFLLERVVTGTPPNVGETLLLRDVTQDPPVDRHLFEVLCKQTVVEYFRAMTTAVASTVVIGVRPVE